MRPSTPEPPAALPNRKETAVTDRQPSVVDNPGACRFEVLVGGEVAGFAEYRRNASTVAFTHTVIEDGFQGRGLGAVLAGHVLGQTREAGLQVLPFCPFIRSYIQRHPEYADLVPAERRVEFERAPESEQRPVI